MLQSPPAVDEIEALYAVGLGERSYVWLRHGILEYSSRSTNGKPGRQPLSLV